MLEDIKRLVEAGFAAHLLRRKSKAPIDADWSRLPIPTFRELERRFTPGMNVGVRPGEPSKIGRDYLQILDIDIRDPKRREEAMDAARDFVQALDEMPAVASGSGGGSLHIYFVTDKPFPSRKLARSPEKIKGADGKLHNAWEIELYGTGKQVVLPPSIHPDTGKPYRWLRPWNFNDPWYIKSRTVEDWLDRETRRTDEEPDDLSALIRQSPTNLPVRELKEYLNDLPPDMCDDYHDWLKIGAAIHHEFNGSEKGRELWRWYSEISDKYEPDVLDDKWESFKGSKNPVTFRTIIRAANQERRGRTLDEIRDADKSDRREEDDSWRKRLDFSGEGQIKPTMANIVLILRNDDRISGMLAWNVLLHAPVIMKTFPAITPSMTELRCDDQINGARWLDTHDHNMRLFLESRKKSGGYGMKVTDRDLIAAINVAAKHNSFHPVQEYLNKLEWDGKERIATLFQDYLGSPDDKYSREISELFLIGAVARAFEPGCKFDFAPILDGPQGIGKTTFAETLAVNKSWFGSLAPDFHQPQKMVESMLGKWLVEIPELAGFNKSDIRSIKFFFSSRKDTTRLSYDRRPQDFLRACILIGTTNDNAYLIDETGNRRYWPRSVLVKSIDIERLRRNIDQLYAEAVVVYRNMRKEQPHGDLPLYIVSEEAQAIAKEEQDARLEPSTADMWAATINAWLDTPLEDRDFVDIDDPDRLPYRIRTTLKDVWDGALKAPPATYSTQHARTLGSAMKMIKGWTLIGPRYDSQGNMHKTWERIGGRLAPIFQKKPRRPDLV